MIVLGALRARHCDRDGGRAAARSNGSSACTRRWSASWRAALADVSGLASSCHAGYSVTDAPFQRTVARRDTHRLESSLARELALDPQRVRGRPRAPDARRLHVSQVRSLGDRSAHGGHRDQRCSFSPAVAQRRGSSARVALPAEARLDAARSSGVSCSSAASRCSSSHG